LCIPSHALESIQQQVNDFQRELQQLKELENALAAQQEKQQQGVQFNPSVCFCYQ
jgi:hypothetical protein